MKTLLLILILSGIAVLIAANAFMFVHLHKAKWNRGGYVPRSNPEDSN